jgi:LemA protein
MKGTRNLSILIILGLVLIFGVWGCSSYNGFASANKEIDGKWGEVENQFDRKAKLYTNVVNAIKGAATNEDTTLIKIIQMRSRIPDIKPDQNNPQQLADVNTQFTGLGRSMMNINFENYPVLKTQDMFRDLQAQIEGTENRITKAIGDWNTEVKNFNKKTVVFPGNMIAKLFGFKEKPVYKAKEGAEDTEVNFSK